MTPLAAAFDDYRVADSDLGRDRPDAPVRDRGIVARRERVASGRDVVCCVGAALVPRRCVGELVIGNVRLLLLELLARGIDRPPPRDLERRAGGRRPDRRRGGDEVFQA